MFSNWKGREGRYFICCYQDGIGSGRVIGSYFLSILRETRALCWELKRNGIARLSASSFLEIEFASTAMSREET